ncbi:MAG: Iron complex outerrane recepter protein [Verrucomicrobia bacterium]|nr:Iron complex outerrane recepter protein [Verrucomicrobiota bacterium]
MITRRPIIFALLSILASASPALSLRAQAPAHPQYFQLTQTLAQSLVDDLPKTGPDVQCGLIHAVLYDGINHAVIASYKLSQVGEADEAEDNIVTDEQCVIINPRIEDKVARWNVRLPVKDASGATIKASWSIYFYRRPGVGMPEVLARAIVIRDDLAKRIPSLAALFEPAPKR